MLLNSDTVKSFSEGSAVTPFGKHQLAGSQQQPPPTTIMAASMVARASCRLPLLSALRSSAAVAAAPRTSWRHAHSSGSVPRSFSSFTIYYDSNEAASKTALATLESADAPFETAPILKKSPKEDALLKVALALTEGADKMLRDNSWPRVTNPSEIAAVCANNSGLMQRPIIVSPDGLSAVTVPLASDPEALLSWINAQTFTPVSTTTAAAAAAAAAAATPPVDNFYASMSEPGTISRRFGVVIFATFAAFLTMICFCAVSEEEDEDDFRGLGAFERWI